MKNLIEETADLSEKIWSIVLKLLGRWIVHDQTGEQIFCFSTSRNLDKSCEREDTIQTNKWIGYVRLQNNRYVHNTINQSITIVLESEYRSVYSVDRKSLG